MHRDIKPKNILVNNGILKVGDFGLATKFNDSKEAFKEYKGTLITMAPEVKIKKIKMKI
jgi:eukaryotic-like serine/threonine-protein kinase